MHERLLELRKKLQLTQADFAKKINLASSTIWAYEKGQRLLTDRVISDICRVYNVNEEWLRTGEGLMFQAPQSLNVELGGEIGKLLRSDDDFTKELFLRYLKLPPEFKRQFEDFLYSVAEKLPKRPEK